MTLRIANLNTWVGLLVRGLSGVQSVEPPGHKKQRFNALVAEILERDVDVVTLQECVPLPSFAREVARALDYDLIWRVQNSGPRVLGFGLPTGIGRGAGLAIVAKRGLGLKHVDTKRLSGSGLVTNLFSIQLGPHTFAIAGLVHKGGRPALIVNTHIRYSFPSEAAFFEGWEQLRERGTVNRDPPAKLLKSLRNNRTIRDAEVRRLGVWLHTLSEKHDAPVILGADFNLDPDTPQLLRFIETTGYDNVLPHYAPEVLTWDPATNYNIGFGNTIAWPSGEPKSRVLQLMAILDSVPQTPDHIMVSRGLEAVAAGLAFDQPREGILASDHYGIWADISFVQDVARPQARASV